MINSTPASDESNKAAIPEEASAKPVAMRVSEIMTREIKTLGPDQTFGDVVSLMAKNTFHHIIVAVDGHLMGVLSDRDVYRQLGRVEDWSAKRVGEIMITDALTIPPDTLLSDAAALMLARRINCLPVVGDDGKLVGLLTSTDIIRVFKGLQERLEEAAL